MRKPPEAQDLRDESTLGWVCVGLLSALALATGLWSVFLLPPSDLFEYPEVRVRVAESMLLAGPGLFFITLYAGRAVRSRIGSLIPALLWLAVVVAASAGRPEGDSAYLLASYQGLLLAPLGMVAGALGMARSARKPWPVEVPRLREQVPAPRAEIGDQVASVKDQ